MTGKNWNTWKEKMIIPDSQSSKFKGTTIHYEANT